MRKEFLLAGNYGISRLYSRLYAGLSHIGLSGSSMTSFWSKILFAFINMANESI
jgi:hypothetical protein